MGKRSKSTHKSLQTRKRDRGVSKSTVNPFSNPHQSLKKRKGTHNPSANNTKVSKRKRTNLSTELKRVSGNKRNSFVDKRYSRHFQATLDVGTKESIRVKRFQKERQKQLSKQTRFNLDDDEDDQFSSMLSIKPTSELHTRSRPSDSEEDEMPEEDMIAQFRQNANRPKTKQEALHEVIMKSKYYKMERQELALEQRDTLAELDSDLKDIRSLMNHRSTNSDDESEAMDDYDKKARRMIFNRRIQPSDRMKTSEELAEEKRRKFEELEKERLKRQMAESASVKKQRAQQFRPTDDDLIEDWVVDKSLTSAYCDSDDDDDFPSAGVALQFDDDKKKGNQNKTALTKITAVIEDDGEEAGDIRSPPESYEEFCDMLKGKTPLEQVAICNTIRKLCQESEHKQKIKEFFAFLLDRFRDICISYTSEKPVQTPISDLNVLSDVLFRLSHDSPDVAANSFRMHLKSVQKSMVDIITSQSLQNHSDDAHGLLFLKALANIFSTSDFRHSLVTPALLLLGQRLSHKPENGRDICSSLYTCCLLLHYIRKSKRYVPEIIRFFLQLLNSPLLEVKRTKSPKESMTQPESNSNVSSSPKSNPLKSFSPSQSSSTSTETPKHSTLRFFLLWEDIFSNEFQSNTFRKTAICLTLFMISKCVDIYGDMQCFPQIFTPIEKALKGLTPRTIRHCQEVHRALLGKILLKRSQAVAIRKPLVLRRAFVPLRQYAPKYDEDFDPERKFNTNDKRDEIRKLKRNLHEAKRAAVRELRRDNVYIAAEERKRAKEIDEDKEEKQKEIRKFMEATKTESIKQI